MDKPQARTAPGLLDEFADAQPEREAVIDGSHRWSYDELRKQSKTVADVYWEPGQSTGVGYGLFPSKIISRDPMTGEVINQGVYPEGTRVGGIDVGGQPIDTPSKFSGLTKNETDRLKEGLQLEAKIIDPGEFIGGMLSDKLKANLKHTKETGETVWNTDPVTGAQTTISTMMVKPAIGSESYWKQVGGVFREADKPATYI